MQQRIYSNEIVNHVGERVRLAGWLHQLRRLSNVSFLILRDRKGLAQITLDDPALIEHVRSLYNESVLQVEGLVVREPQAPGGVELREPSVVVISPASIPPPIDLFRPHLRAQLPTVLDHAALTLRHPHRRALFKIASASMHGFRSALRKMEFTEIQTPKIIAAATEGGANVFTIDYLGKPAYLAQSPQFYKQIMIGVFERVFEVGPAFRAEPHDTPRHLNEYVSLDAEIGFIEDHTTVMQTLACGIAGMISQIQEEAASEVKLLGITLPEMSHTIPSIHFSDALELITRETGEDVLDEPDLAPAHERFLGEWARREQGSEFIFVTGYPMLKRPFYTHPDPHRPEYSNSFDLIFRGLELVTGGQRLHLYDHYIEALKKRNLSPEPFEGYLEAFRFGMPPHGGFAIGLERWVARLAEAQNIRETTLFPRDLHRLAP